MKNIRLIKNEARTALKGHWGIAIGVFLLMIVINGALNIVAPIDESMATTRDVVLAFLSILISIFVAVPLTTGFQWFYLNLYDGEKLAAKQLFTAFGKGYYLKVIWANILVGLMLLLWTLPALLIGILLIVLAPSEAMMGIFFSAAMLLLIIPVIKGYSYSQTFYLIKDNPTLSAGAAISTSTEIMAGKRWKLFLTQISFIGWVVLPLVLGIYGGWLMLRVLFDNSINQEVSLAMGFLFFLLAILIGILVSIYLAPYYQTTMASFYRMLQPREMVIEEEYVDETANTTATSAVDTVNPVDDSQFLNDDSQK